MKQKFRESGGGRKPQAIEVRQAMFEWFVDVRGRLHVKIFRSKCIEVYESWLKSKKDEVKDEEKLKFSKCWIQGWMKEYQVSLLKPSKRFAIPQQEREIRIKELIKNVLRVRNFLIKTYGKEPVIINGDQMPIHRNESSTLKTMTLKGQSTYVKEN